MARRGREKSTDSAENAASPATRVAVPGRELVSFNPRSGMVASTLATAAVLGTSAAGLAPAVSAGAAAALVAGVGARFSGKTLSQWVALRRGSDVLPDQAALFSRDGMGVIFDGTSISALVEITPRPWQMTTVSATGASESPVISADLLRPQLRQYDIGLSRLAVICAGYKFAARDHAAAALDTLIGPVSVPLGGLTVIQVSLDLQADILGPAYRRAKRESLPDGLCQTLSIAATRICHVLAEQGFGGRLMSAPAVREFHDAVLSQVAGPLSSPGWRNCGPRSEVHTRTYVPARGHWNAESAGGWNHLQAHRQYTTLTLTPQGDGQALAQPLITYLVRSGEAMAKASGYGLRPAVGQQVAGLNQALPVSTRLPLRSTGALIDEHRHLGFGVPAGGAGMFVGSRADKTRVFVAVSPASEPLWLSGPRLFAMQMVARLSTQDQRISVMIDEPAWQRLAEHRDTPVLTVGTVESVPADVVVCTPQWWERHRELCAGKAVMLVTEEAPGRGATNSLTVQANPAGHSEIAVAVDEQSTTVLWELTPMERRALLGDVDASGTAAPREGSDLKLGQVVNLPVSEPVRPKRRVAPAPAVETIGQTAVPEKPAARPAPAPPKRRVKRAQLGAKDVTNLPPVAESPPGAVPVTQRRRDPRPADKAPAPKVETIPTMTPPPGTPPPPQRRKRTPPPPPAQAPPVPPRVPPPPSGRHHRPSRES
ncbi:type VII secretion protein EccE [Mycolicibacterium sp.]|uniref:type VII secretion protein EccE n=1 Tax=Mycolicibacterium sp. TaxID=2320850 RepID=UPI00356021CF